MDWCKIGMEIFLPCCATLWKKKFCTLAIWFVIHGHSSSTNPSVFTKGMWAASRLPCNFAPSSIPTATVPAEKRSRARVDGEAAGVTRPQDLRGDGEIEEWYVKQCIKKTTNKPKVILSGCFEKFSLNFLLLQWKSRLNDWYIFFLKSVSFWFIVLSTVIPYFVVMEPPDKTKTIESNSMNDIS